MRVLLIGMGSIGKRHFKNLSALGHTVNTFDTHSPNCETTYFKFQDALSDKPEAILIATPPDTHLDVAARCFMPHVPIFIEKPLSTDPIRAFDFLREASRQYVTVAVGYQMRAIPARRELWKTVSDGGLGNVYAAHAEFAFDMGKWRKQAATYQAGIIAEASHELDQLCWMLGTPHRVVAAADTDNDHERLGLGVIEFESGARATFFLDGLAPEYRRSLTIYGDKATQQIGFEHIDNDLAYQRELVAWLDGHPYCDGRQALVTVRLLAAITRSRLTGGWVKVLH